MEAEGVCAVGMIHGTYSLSTFCQKNVLVLDMIPFRVVGCPICLRFELRTTIG